MISIVVPVYRVEDYIVRCLDSLMAQTYADFEAILVDDGSPDRSGEICDAYAAQDGRFRVIHRENGGLSAARNTGLAAVRGEFVLFLDSDDWLHPRTLELLLSAVTEQNADMAMGNFQTVGAWCEPLTVVAPSVLAMSGRDALLRLYEQGGARFVVAWGKLWRRKRLAGLHFPEGRIHEDEATTYRLLYPLERMALVEAPLYFYYQNLDSITRAAYSVKRLDGLTALEEQIDFYRARSDEALVKQTVRGYLQKATENLDSIRVILRDAALAEQVVERVETFCRERGLRISCSERLLLTGDTASKWKLRTAKIRDLVYERGFWGCIVYYWKKI
ncbi:MAG: glycosyltransferase family 2 protein [Clostridia bacterium]|nr:glycosyltransferase family 2 protein [Clostridia bacterium]